MLRLFQKCYTGYLQNAILDMQKKDLHKIHKYKNLLTVPHRKATIKYKRTIVKCSWLVFKQRLKTGFFHKSCVYTVL